MTLIDQLKQIGVMMELVWPHVDAEASPPLAGYYKQAFNTLPDLIQKVEALEKQATEKPEVVRLTSKEGDWIGLYVAGILVVENHSLRERDVLDALGYEYKSLERDQDWFDQHGCSCPGALTEDMKAELAGDNPDGH